MTGDYARFAVLGVLPWCDMARASVSLMRDCQPSPVARYAARTSGSNRNDMRTFGLSIAGRPGPRFSAASTSGIAARIGFARAKSALVISGISSSGVMGFLPAIFFLLSVVRAAEADNADLFAPQADGHEVQPTIPAGKGPPARFRVIVTGVLKDRGVVPVQFFDVGKIETVFLDVAKAFFLVPFRHHHEINVGRKLGSFKSFRPTKIRGCQWACQH